MKNTRVEKALSLVLVTALFACADSANRIAGPTTSPADITARTATSASSGERAALTRIARLVALAMDNEPARQHLKRDMRAAPFREHKLQLGSYLRSKDGKALLEQMVAANGGTADDLLATVTTIRPLELYMPVAKHRETWTGNARVLVVSQLSEAEPIVAFDDRGQTVTLDRTGAPEQPTLSIVPVETQFDQPMNLLRSKNARDQNGTAIGTLEPVALKSSSVIACDVSCSDTELLPSVTEGSGGGGGGTTNPGLYLEFSRLLDAKEPWFRGAPEVEVHIHGPTDPSSPRYGADLSCAGEHAYDYRRVFDQNDAFWTGKVLLFTESEAAAYAAKFSDGFNIMFWEDDNTPCTIKTDVNELKSALEATGRGGIALATKLIPGAGYLVAAGFFVASLFSSADWLLTNDDFLGVAVIQGNLGYALPNTTHVIMIGTTLNGRAQIYWRQ